MFLKDLRKMNNEKIVESLNSAQRSYNNRFKVKKVNTFYTNFKKMLVIYSHI